jgi:hypothetical protein
MCLSDETFDKLDTRELLVTQWAMQLETLLKGVNDKTDSR